MLQKRLQLVKWRMTAVWLQNEGHAGIAYVYEQKPPGRRLEGITRQFEEWHRFLWNRSAGSHITKCCKIGRLVEPCQSCRIAWRKNSFRTVYSNYPKWRSDCSAFYLSTTRIKWCFSGHYIQRDWRKFTGITSSANSWSPPTILKMEDAVSVSLTLATVLESSLVIFDFFLYYCFGGVLVVSPVDDPCSLCVFSMIQMTVPSYEFSNQMLQQWPSGTINTLSYRRSGRKSFFLTLRKLWRGSTDTRKFTVLITSSANSWSPTYTYYPK